RRLRYRRAAPVYRGDRLAPRRMTILVRSAGARSRPEATSTSPTQSARRESRRRARAHESRATRPAFPSPPARRLRSLRRLVLTRPAEQRRRFWATLSLWESPRAPPTAPQPDAAVAWARRRPGP